MINSIQGLRVIGMLFIFFYHCNYMNEGKLSNLYNTFFYDGYFAVTFFFIISGFLTYRSMSKQVSDNIYKDSIIFIKRKLKGVYLLHILTLIYFILKEMQYGNNIKRMILSIPNALLIQSFIPIKSIYLGFNGVSWFLSSLMFCYCISIFLVKLVRKIKAEKSTFYLIWIYILQLISVYIFRYTQNHHWIFYINPLFRSIDFIIGMLLSKVLLNKDRINIGEKIGYNFLEIGSIILFCIFYSNARYIPQIYRWNVYYTPILILIIYILYFQRGIVSDLLSSKIMLYLANISFEFYMLHQIITIKYSKICPEKPLIQVIISLVIALILSIITNRITSYIRVHRKVEYNI